MFRVVVTMVDTIEICCDSLQIIVISETKLSLTAAQTTDPRNNVTMMSLRCSRFLHTRSPLPKPLFNTRPSHTLSRLIAPKVLSKNTSAAYYATAVLIAFLGLTYASVPIYRIVCAKTGWGGTPMTDSTKFSAEHMVPVPTASGRRIKVSFSASTSDSLPWSFRPQQREISILPGETALAFYKAKNKSSEDIIGIATYNVPPLSLSVCHDRICP